MYSQHSASSQIRYWMPMAVVFLVLLSACVGPAPRLCPPDQLTTLPPSNLLQPCRQDLCRLPNDFATLSLDGQAQAINACHEADVALAAACARKDKQLVDWVVARAVKPAP